jgi:hypothetical protein
MTAILKPKILDVFFEYWANLGHNISHFYLIPLQNRMRRRSSLKEAGVFLITGAIDRGSPAETCGLQCGKMRSPPIVYIVERAFQSNPYALYL